MVPKLVLILLIATSCASVVIEKAMGQWNLHINSCPKKQFSGMDLDTSMPTSLHLDLLRHDKIVDPFKESNWESLKWVSECNITYSKKINLSDQLMKSQKIELVFEGVDTYSTIYFNDQKILETQNAFVEYRAEILSEWIKKNGENVIKIEMYGTHSFDQKADAKNKMPFIYAHSRKACYQYSWDWAPFLNTIGVWKDIYFVGSDDVRIDYVWARNHEVTQEFAIINFAVALKHREGGSVSGLSLEIFEGKDNYEKSITKIPLTAENYIYNEVQIDNPRLWWPHGIGEPNVYDFIVAITKDKKVIDEKKIVFGIRTVELDLKNKMFTVMVNGYPIYCKGANYVPPDMLYARLANPDYKPGNTIENLLHDAIDSNYNMIRLWGGGQYESNQLLEMASRMGIMIFYDFMFSDSIYPSTLDFLRNVEVEIRQQVQRARNYPALVLWSGNNEILQGIKAWGWGKQEYKDNYNKLFEDLIPKIIEKQNPETPYIPSSPIYGIGNSGFQRGGDIHYWGVWAGGSDFDAYKNALGPFNSEFGTQALPVWQTILDFVSQKNANYKSKEFGSHERHGSKFNTLQKYIKNHAHPSKDMEMEAYLSGLIQAYGVEIAIISQRTAKPRSWGTLYWQFNDAWPGISWSSIDYFGRWKPLQYMAKRSYPNVAIFCQDGKVSIINDNLYQIEVSVIVKVQQFDGQILFNKTQNVHLAENSVKSYLNLTNYNSGNVVVYTEIIAGRNKEMWSTAFFKKFKDLNLDASAQLFVKYNKDYDMIFLRTDKFIKNLQITCKKEYVKFSDNYFDMISGKVYKVSVLPSHYGKEALKLENIIGELVYRSYIQIYSDEKLNVIQE